MLFSIFVSLFDYTIFFFLVNLLFTKCRTKKIKLSTYLSLLGLYCYLHGILNVVNKLLNYVFSSVVVYSVECDLNQFVYVCKFCLLNTKTKHIKLRSQPDFYQNSDTYTQNMWEIRHIFVLECISPPWIDDLNYKKL
jgi:hypothetical protein